ncbi:MAG: sigma-70 family RNA polymerase sigma factor [Chloroflexota bacterium]
MVSPVETIHLAAARSGDQQHFSELIEPYQCELRAYCYRLLGSLQDAEDAVQETMLRAWRRLDTFEGRASFRAWLYKIATNVSLDALDKAKRRGLPSTLYPPADPQTSHIVPINDPIWLDPFPDDWLDESAMELETHYALRESVTLAFLTALQVLPPRQRAVLVLCDVLDWRASEVAQFLAITTSAANSALHRARSTLSKHYLIGQTKPATISSSTRTLLERYVRAWETTDVAGLVSLLKEDATYTMPPTSTWFQGREAVRRFFASSIFVQGLSYRLQPIHVSSQPGFAAYLHNPQSDQFEAHAIHVLNLNNDQLVALTTFLNPALFSHFGLPNLLNP